MNGKKWGKKLKNGILQDQTPQLSARGKHCLGRQRRRESAEGTLLILKLYKRQALRDNSPVHKEPTYLN